VTFAELVARTIERLDQAEIPYMLTGSLASTFHGEPRATRDVDVIIDPAPEALAWLIDDLLMDGFYVDRDAAMTALRERSQFNAIGTEGIKVDFLIRKDRPFSRAEFERRQRVELLGFEGYIASVEDLILAKLEWAAQSDSERQVRDVAGMVAVAGDTLDRGYVTTWADRLGLAEAWRRVANDTL
jgi:hypothetical protein